MKWFSRQDRLPSGKIATVVDLATTEAGLAKLLTDNSEIYRLVIRHLSENFLREFDEKGYTAEDIAFIRGAGYMLKRVTQLVSQEIQRACDQNISKRGEG